VARRQVTVPKVLDLNTLAVAMERLLRRVLGEPIELVTRFAERVWPIKADPAQLEQILMNLAVNARDAMPGGGKLTIRTQNVKLGAPGASRPLGLAPGSYVMLEVTDTGVGMSQEIFSHVFEPFFTTKPIGEGTGLGLATVYGAVKQSGGQVWVNSRPGEGTTFRLYFPRCQEPFPERETGPDTHDRGGCERVLVLEDDPAVRNFSVRALQRAGYVVDVAESGEQALGIAEHALAPIDMLVTDVVMPRLSGPEVARRLSGRYPALKVLYVSGYAPETVFPEGRVEDGASFLAKPYTTSMLLSKVRDLLDAPVSQPHA